MIRKTLVLVFLSFAYAKFCYAEITETELSDGTIVRSTTTRITNADKPVNTNGGNMQDGTGNYSFRNRLEPIIIVNPPAGPKQKSRLAPDSGYAPHNGYVPDFGSDR
ncbi:MAG: hypothetical protein ACR65O_09115 [Methylomicrobium sp.]